MINKTLRKKGLFLAKTYFYLNLIVSALTIKYLTSTLTLV